MPRDSSNPLTQTHSQAPYRSLDGPVAPKRKHICPTCERGFTTSGHLARHTRIHTGERNHKCPFPGCETRCSRQDNLQQHYRIHLSPGSRRTSARGGGRPSYVKRAAPAPGEESPTPSESGSRATSPPPLSAPPALALARPSYPAQTQSASPPPLSYPSRRQSLSPDLSPYSPLSHTSLPSPVLVPDHNVAAAHSRYPGDAMAGHGQYRMNGNGLSNYHEQQQQAYAANYPAYANTVSVPPPENRLHSSPSSTYDYQHQHLASQEVSLDGNAELIPHTTAAVRHMSGQYFAPQPQHPQYYHSPVDSNSPSSSSGPSSPPHDAQYHHHVPAPHSYQPPPPPPPQPSNYTSSELQHAGYSSNYPSHTHRYQKPSPPPVLAPIRHDMYESQPQMQHQQYRVYSDHGSISAASHDSLDSQWKSDARTKNLGMGSR